MGRGYEGRVWGGQSDRHERPLSVEACQGREVDGKVGVGINRNKFCWEIS